MFFSEEEEGRGEMRMGFAPAAREDDARAAARGLEPRMRWTCPAQCWAVRRDAIVGVCSIVVLEGVRLFCVFSSLACQSTWRDGGVASERWDEMRTRRVEVKKKSSG